MIKILYLVLDLLLIMFYINIFHLVSQRLNVFIVIYTLMNIMVIVYSHVRRILPCVVIDVSLNVNSIRNGMVNHAKNYVSVDRSSIN